MIPQKLKLGDEIRVIAPSSSLGIISQTNRDLAVKRLGELGLKISYSKNAEEIDDFHSSVHISSFSRMAVSVKKEGF